MIFSSGPFVFLQDAERTYEILKHLMTTYLCTGDPAIIGLSTAIASDVTQGTIQSFKMG